MDYRTMTTEELAEIERYAYLQLNFNAAIEIDDFRKFYGKIVEVVKGRKVPLHTVGKVFWVKRRNYSKYADPWGIYSATTVGIKTDDGTTYFTNCKNVVVIE